MRAAMVIGLLTACGFTGHAMPDDPKADAPTSTDDGKPIAQLCTPNDSYQKVCFSFDQAFRDPLANEGSVAVAAALDGVTAEHVDGRDVARFGPARGMFITDGTAITNILSTEIVFRADRLPTLQEERFALFDNGDHFSAFLYNVNGQPALRCELEAVWYSVLAPAVNQWTYLACVCDGGTKRMYIDGVEVQTIDDNDHVGQACEPAVATGDGVTIGMDNVGNGTVGVDPLIGVIDHVRLWSSKLFPQTICQHAGSTGC